MAYQGSTSVAAAGTHASLKLGAEVIMLFLIV